MATISVKTDDDIRQRIVKLQVEYLAVRTRLPAEPPIYSLSEIVRTALVKGLTAMEDEIRRVPKRIGG